MPTLPYPFPSIAEEPPPTGCTMCDKFQEKIRASLMHFCLCMRNYRGRGESTDSWGNTATPIIFLTSTFIHRRFILLYLVWRRKAINGEFLKYLRIKKSIFIENHTGCCKNIGFCCDAVRLGRRSNQEISFFTDM